MHINILNVQKHVNVNGWQGKCYNNELCANKLIHVQGKFPSYFTFPDILMATII